MYQINSHILRNVTTERRLNIIIDYLTHGLILTTKKEEWMNDEKLMNEWNGRMEWKKKWNE